MIVIFRSRLRAENQAEYEKLAPRMLELAQSMPGFVSFDAYTGEDGERVAIIEFESEETLNAWREHPEHLIAQKLGRTSFYSEYSLQVCEGVRASEFRYKSESQ
jgi:heme-degrading monooxygenase HmoA